MPGQGEDASGARHLWTPPVALSVCPTLAGLASASWQLHRPCAWEWAGRALRPAWVGWETCT